ncbi:MULTISPECIES: HD-GYP domain-containing protein [unclassified Fusibacter]|uniref:HD-GYP domain-containing protein n=1 Tax=unclassified Fusibacter TaxID=2624464 RepID=UPI001012D2A6|nr:MULTISPECIES: HD-GYP domain-containing protein [unclassified Fusibacter]MCK8061043.1 HD-GYP domain-containing protein [Fusibacter sp. A2]NPE20503.1 HD-GYP domain-containing protein [Fusibacter sp. A1]RXV63703.1 HD-GYP domain-containing protein [Fusibacter sp. A1]
MYREIIMVTVSELEEGMVLAENIYDTEGNILLASGIKLRNTYINKIEETLVTTVAIEALLKHESPEESQSVRIALIKEKREKRIIKVREQAKEKLELAVTELLESEAVNAQIIQAVVKKIINDILNSDEVVFHIDQLREVDSYLFDHAINVTILAIVMSIHTGFDKNALREIAMGAILHDIGKLFVDQNILNKPESLSIEEFSMIKHHSKLGYEVLRRSEDISERSARIALNHHEQHCGSGYPQGLKGDEIDAFSKIVNISDVFDALTSDRVYSKKISPYSAMNYIVAKSGIHFDPKTVKEFSSAVGYFYHGAIVKLMNGDVAVVTVRHRHKPVVRIVQDAGNNKMHGHFEIDLMKNPSVRIKEILVAGEYEHMEYFKRKNEGIS